MKCESYLFYVSNFIFKRLQENTYDDFADDFANAFGKRYDLRDLKVFGCYPWEII